MLYQTNTFSIVAYDPVTEELGVGVQSKFLAVGSLVPWVRQGVGAIATQAKTNSGFIEKAFSLLQGGMDPDNVISCLLEEDPHVDIRQIGIVDSQGRSSAYTGSNCIGWAGHKRGENYCCQGNVLLGEIVLSAMSEAFEQTRGDLADRLLAALEAAQEAGGERRGRQSAALVVEKSFHGMLGESHRYIDLRIDHSSWPLHDLKKLLQMHRVDYAPNHRDKFYSFEGETRERILTILTNLGYIRILKDHDSLEDVLKRLSEKWDITPAFREKAINGKLVHHLVTMWYDAEYVGLQENP